mgnify:CR=1 FL=1
MIISYRKKAAFLMKEAAFLIQDIGGDTVWGQHKHKRVQIVSSYYCVSWLFSSQILRKKS